MTEEWRPIVGYEKYYEVSNFGRVRSLDRIITRKNRWNKISEFLLKGKILTGRIRKNGYYNVIMCSENTNRFEMSIHRAVGLTFIPNPENKKTVNHKDGNKGNNHIKNLEWSTHSENLKHSFSSGFSKSYGRKFRHRTIVEVKSIIKMYNKNIPMTKIAGKFKTSTATVHRIVNNLVFKNI